MTPLLSALRSRKVVAVAIGTVVAFGMMAARQLGLLEPLELAHHDRSIRRSVDLDARDVPVTLLGLRERDIRDYGYPLSDVLLTRILANLLAAEPRAIGVDLYRDAPVPRARGGLDGLEPTPEYEALGDLVMSDERIVMTMRFSSSYGVGTPAPSFLVDSSQVGFADIPVDPGGIIRRSLLFLWDGDASYLSLSLQLALRYLHADDITLTADSDEPSHVRLGATTIPPLSRSDGPYVAADAGGYQFLHDYRTGTVPAPSIEMPDVIEGRFDPELVRDRIVLIGSSAPSVSDIFYTPFSRAHRAADSMDGIQVHAHTVGQLLRFALGESHPLRSPHVVAIWLWIWLWGLLGAGLAYWNRSFWLSAALTGLSIYALVTTGYALFARGWFVPVLPPALAGGLSVGLVSVALAVIERKERRQVAGLFSRFLRPSVADEIWRQREEFMGGERRAHSRRGTLTVLMSDLEAFTATSEQLAPELFMAWISEYMVAMAEEVDAHQGVVDDYAGDGIKANFGFPVLRSNDAEIAADAVSAVSCALSMGRRMDALNESWKRRDYPTGRCRAGIFTGPAVVGCIGGDESLKYTSVGTTINTASRLESFHKEDFRFSEGDPSWRVIIADETLKHLGDAFEIEDLGLHELRGKPDKVHVYRVLGHAPAHGA